MTTVDVVHYTAEDLPEIRQHILDTHVEVRQRDFGLTGPFYEVERFDERLSAYASRPGWTAVLGYEDGEVVGFCFGTTLAAHTKWWGNMFTPLPAAKTAENGMRTVALNEIVVRKAWRGRSVAWQLHEAWLSHRAEERVTLLVNPINGDGLSRLFTKHGAIASWATSSRSQTRPCSPSCCAPLLRPMGSATPQPGARRCR